jgi:hypothetical protein
MATFTKKALDALHGLAKSAAGALVTLENNLKLAATQIVSMTTNPVEQAGLVKGEFKPAFGAGLGGLMAEALAIKEYPTANIMREVNKAIKNNVATDAQKDVKAKVEKYGKARKDGMDRVNKAASRVLAHLQINDAGVPVVKATNSGDTETSNRTPEARIKSRLDESKAIAEKRTESAAKYLQPYCQDVKDLMVLVGIAEQQVAEASKAAAEKKPMPERVWVKYVEPSVTHYKSTLAPKA